MYTIQYSNDIDYNSFEEFNIILSWRDCQVYRSYF